MTTMQSPTIDEFEDFDDEEDFLPVEKKSRLNARNLSRGMLGAVALVLVFSGGAYAQRTWGDSGSSGGGAAGAMPDFAQAAGRTGATGATQSSTSTTSNATTGTIKVVDGDSFYVTTTSGEVVKVTTNSTSTITRTATATVGELKPGETVVVQGTKNDDGTVTATRVTDGSSGGFGGGQMPTQ